MPPLRRGNIHPEGLGIKVAPSERLVLTADAEITAAPEDERSPVRIEVVIEHLAHEDYVIAPLVSIGSLAFEDGERIRKNRAAGFPSFVIDAVPLAGRLAPEPRRQIFLPFAQDVHGEMIGRKISLEAVGAAAEAPQDERRIEGNRVEGIGRIADQLAPWPTRRDHRDAGCERAERVAKLAQIDGG